jgi:hypothetical protein
MRDDKFITLFKLFMVVGILSILTGIFLHMYDARIEAMAATGIIISAGCVAFSMMLSLPTKMFITLLLAKQEADLAKKSSKRPK